MFLQLQVLKNPPLSCWSSAVITICTLDLPPSTSTSLWRESILVSVKLFCNAGKLRTRVPISDILQMTNNRAVHLFANFISFSASKPIISLMRLMMRIWMFIFSDVILTMIMFISCWRMRSAKSLFVVQIGKHVLQDILHHAMANGIERKQKLREASWGSCLCYIWHKLFFQVVLHQWCVTSCSRLREGVKKQFTESVRKKATPPPPH